VPIVDRNRGSLLKYAWQPAYGKHRQQMRQEPPDAPWWICFDEATHTYTDSDGVRYKSVTRHIAAMDEPFNPERAAIECASNIASDYYGMTPEEIMRQWRDTADVGTELHAAIEAWLKGEWHDSDSNELQPLVDQFACLYHTSFAARKTTSEMLLWDRDLRLAGTADIVTIQDDGRIRIDDIKTWRKLSPDRQGKCDKQLTIYAGMLRKIIPTHAVDVGGVVLFEDYYRKRRNATCRYVPCSEKVEQVAPSLWARGQHRRHGRATPGRAEVMGRVRRAYARHMERG